MTDVFAAAVSTHCPLLRKLALFFAPGSHPAELFTDAGLIALTEGCPLLEELRLENCAYLTDRSLYAAAANCPHLASLHLSGYHERITDYGLTVLFEACHSMRRAALSWRLCKVRGRGGVQGGGGGCGDTRRIL